MQINSLIMKKPFIIVGANLTGLSIALALSKLNQPSILIDRKEIAPSADTDGRAIALSYGSKQILEEIGIWDKLAPAAGTIEQIRVTDQYSPLFLHFDNACTMGYLIESNDLLKLIYESAVKDSNITMYSNSSYELLENNHDEALVKLNDQIFKTKLLIAADGKFSALRKACKINHFTHDYQQTAIVCKVQHQQTHNNIAQEMFLPNGPFAILPLKDPHQAGIVWTEKPALAEILLKLDQEQFNYFLQEKFTDYLGKVELISKVIAYPLQLIMAEKYYQYRVMLIGDSAHSIHPIAGQGFNLALRDISSLMYLYQKYENLGLGFGCYQSLKEYQTIRMNDNISMAMITDGLNKLFSNNIPLIRFLRKLGLATVNKIPSLQKFFIEYAMAKRN